MSSGLFKFSKQANDRINRKITDLLQEIYRSVEDEADRIKVTDPNFIIGNSLTITLSVINTISSRVNQANIKYAEKVLESIKKQNSEKPGYGG